MTQKQEWWLVRHAPVNVAYIYGQQDIEADYSDAEAFEKLARIIPKDATYISSDLKRCVQTVQAIASLQNIDPSTIITDPVFREQHFGDWQGLTYDEARMLNTDAYEQFWEDPVNGVLPNGESFHQMSDRVTLGQKKIATTIEEDKILLIAHAGTIRALLANALSIPLEQALSIVVEPLSYSKLTLFKSDGGENWQIDWVNRSAT